MLSSTFPRYLLAGAGAFSVDYAAFLLLWKLNDVGIYSWFWVFAPLWASDAITMLTSTFELRRCYNMQSIGHT